MKFTDDISWVCIVELTDGNYQVYLEVNPERCGDKGRVRYYRCFNDTVSAVAYRVGLCKMPVYSIKHLIRHFNPQGIDLTETVINEYHTWK